MYEPNYDDRGMFLLTDYEIRPEQEVHCPVEDEYGVADVVVTRRGRRPIAWSFDCPVCGAEHEEDPE